jgi:circadian clock protein KaiC
MTTMLPVQKIHTGITGFDLIANGGLPKNRTTLISGTAGSAKSIFASQFLAAGIAQGEVGVFVAIEETPEEIRRNMSAFGWDIAAWEAEKKWVFVDASPNPEETIITGVYDLGALLARIRYAVKNSGATRVSIDSISALIVQFEDTKAIRRDLVRATGELNKLHVTGVITSERHDEYGTIARYGVEEYVTDNVIVLRNVLNNERRRRTVEILKFRGTSHLEGEYPFAIDPEQGIVVFPISAIELKQRASTIRITSGDDDLDAMCGGGLFRDSIMLISGPTGTGKTLMVTEFLNAGVKNGERCLLFAFEESRAQIYRNASGWGMDLDRYEQEGLLRIVCTYPEAFSLEDHLLKIKAVMRDFQPQRVALDSFSALQRIATLKSFREFVITITSHIKQLEVTGMFTATTPTLAGTTSITENHVASITDTIILLRYIEIEGVMNRGITILKMRGSDHDKQIRQFTIDNSGLHIGTPFRRITGIAGAFPVPIITNSDVPDSDDSYTYGNSEE